MIENLIYAHLAISLAVGIAMALPMKGYKRKIPTIPMPKPKKENTEKRKYRKQY